jgi:hypothetical protein
MSQSYLILFSSLQCLLSKVSYETFYHKHCKEGGNCHHPILGDSPKFTFFSKLKKNQNKKIKKMLAMRRKLTKKGCKIGENQAAIFGGLIVSRYAQEWRKMQIQGQIK